MVDILLLVPPGVAQEAPCDTAHLHVVLGVTAS